MRLSPDQCTCGRPFRLIDDVQGRVWDILSFPGAAGGNVSVHPILFFSIMDTLPVSGWQVLQEADGVHLLLTDVRGALDEEVLAGAVRDAVAKQGAVVPRVDVRRRSRFRTLYPVIVDPPRPWRERPARQDLRSRGRMQRPLSVQQSSGARFAFGHS